MAIVRIKQDLSRTDRVVFITGWVVFFLIVARAALGGGATLWSTAVFTGVCVLASVVFNREERRGRQAIGLVIPGVLAVIAGSRWLGGEAGSTSAAWAIAVVAVGGGAAMVVSRGVCVAVYRGWMRASIPIGWSVSHAVLALVFFVVFMPIGVVMRMAGRDPLERRFDRGAQTYWRERAGPIAPARYFRQS